MKQMVILSGKGGTGKTSVTAAFAHLSGSSSAFGRPVFVDADVDASNLSLVLQPEALTPNAFWGGSLAVIDPKACTNCGRCTLVCRFDAIIPHPDNLSAQWIDPIACEGCASCVYACPDNAVTMVQEQEGNWFVSDTSYGKLFHAELFPGRENSGKLVTLVRQQARLHAEDTLARLIIIDGPPGIGCPVISACAGADLGLIVTEPSLAGLHDLKRALGTLQHFRVPAAICVNKADLNPEGTQTIKAFASQEGIAFLGEIPYDENVPKAMLAAKPYTEFAPCSRTAEAILAIWQQAVDLLGMQED